jgi:hypothetical protein
MRAGEKTSLKFLNIINRLGLLKSLKPIHVYYLAKKMTAEAQLKQLNRITIYKPKDIRII